MGNANLPPKIIMTDMDGTLLPPDKIITRNTLDIIKRLQDHNIILCLASARPPAGMMRYINQLQLDTLCAGFNGSVIFKPHSHIYKNITLSTNLVREIVQFLSSYPVEIWLQDYDTWLVSNAETELVKYEQAVTDVIPTKVDNLVKCVRPVCRVVAIGIDSELIGRLEQQMGLHYKEQVAAIRSNPFMLDITAPKATKGNALKIIAELYKIRSEEIVALGDAENDISLLQASGIGIAMGQAPQSVKSVASYVTDSNENEGWANAIEKYVLPVIKR